MDGWPRRLGLSLDPFNATGINVMTFRPLQMMAIAVIAASTVASTAEAQIFGGRGLFGGPGLLPRLGLMPPVYGPGYGAGYGYSGCGECGTSYASTAYAAPSAFSTASYGNACGCASVAQISNPCAVAAAPAPVATACTYVQPVQETVYREMPVVKYKSEQRTATRPVYRQVMEERDVTVYETVNEQRTVDVPYTTYQTVQTCQTAQVDRGRWQTTYHANPKVSPCQYDGRPGFTGWLSRTGYEIRSAFTPKYSARRQYVPNTQTVAYAVNRQVPVTASRQVTYNVARVVPKTVKRQVAVMKLDQEQYTYTARVPYTEMQTVAVGTTTRYAYVGAGGNTATASSPTPASRTAQEQRVRPKTANGNKDNRSATGSNPFQLQSYEPEDQNVDDLQVRLKVESRGWAARNSSTPKLTVAGWRSATSQDQTSAALSVASAE